MLKKVSCRNDGFWQMFDNEYALHQAVWDLFADRPDRERDFIYRMDATGKLPVIYAVSRRRPVNAGGSWDVEIKEYDPQITADMRLGFSVRVNPTVKRDGKRHDVVMDAKHKIRSGAVSDENKKALAEIVTKACVDWLKERSAKNGFDVLAARADGYRQSRFGKKKGGVPIRYSTVDLTGVLQVRDGQSFKNMLFEGFGPEKGFGCGLMLVRKI